MTHTPGTGVPDGLVFVPLGGTGEIGMNLNLYGFQGRWLMVDLGITFGNETTPGIDVMMPDPAFIEDRLDALDGIVITHAHEDHLGAVTYLWPWIRKPVYASPFAAAFLRVKLEEEGLQNEVPLHEIPLGSRFSVGPFDIEMIGTTHSIPEPNALAIRTAAGNVLHTADWKFDPAPQIGAAADKEALRRLGDEGVLAMVGDSTNIFAQEHSGSEGDVRAALIEVVGRNTTGQVAVACFASNVARMESVAVAARENGRHAVLVGRSLYRMNDTARRCGYLGDLPAFLSEEEAAELPADKVLYVCTGSQGEPRAALPRIAGGSHRSVRLGEGDTVIFSSRIIPGNERSIFTMQNRLAEAGVEIITARDAPIHVSGHPSRPEVEEMYRLVRPRVAVPVHGESLHLREHARVAQGCGVEHTILIGDGDVLRLDADPPRVVDQAQTGLLGLDGERLVPMSSQILRDRRRMMNNGAATVTLVLNGKGGLVSEPIVTARGLLDPDEDREDLDTLIRQIRTAVNQLDRRALDDDDTVVDRTRRAVGRFFRGSQNRRPVTDIHVVRVA
ncbi:ribonuclease J [Roseospira marina]|uniref:Ribonuclease J n=1 Tax=Roseospira marina TaxID=140057 RepID=A0A5M6I930_9PROT|nr:ribonuclease J [Roseospira marina]KAA5604770.1 ribonuclease J [Roseospira marina]MBB4313452.1 ribonuclease J [Roseospira marina]MBB5086614.1 ribonuclease J [Roseospira marina]